MEHQYELTFEDYAAFNLHYVKESKTAMQSFWIQRIIGPVIFLSFPFVFSWGKDDFLPMFIVFLILAAAWFFLYPKYFFKAFKGRIKKFMQEGSNGKILGEHTLILDDSGLTDISESGKHSTSWESAEKAVELKEHYLIYINSMQACIIPKRSFKNEAQLGEFKRYFERL
ncbi:YcxB family protein [Metabacillus sp. KIGAM252]|uniref:YcxB family protein n=1 Tax=Metabacillus flavus TaxID=2823519 RepID=A0ABS5LAF5_9BACI|nr:YcxB family protein [Metabacillus flavus]MBS2967568.1 YcxB family protein [Metabacillus flavus]